MKRIVNGMCSLLRGVNVMKVRRCLASAGLALLSCVAWAKPGDPFCLTANEDGCEVCFTVSGITPKPVMECSTDGATWAAYSFDTKVRLNRGNKIYFRAATDTDQIIQSKNAGDTHNRVKATGSVAASGDLTTVLNRHGTTRVPAGTFREFFEECEGLTTPPELPATELGDECYSCMFCSCTNLTVAPALPATNLSYFCYYGMFSCCTALIKAPDLPATVLADGCYQSMFADCTALTEPPVISATKLAGWCCEYMFRGCSSLVNAPALPATTLEGSCYDSMFEGCTALKNAPVLPATELKSYCYRYMFKDCTSLTTAPDLPAKVLAELCYAYMFEGCTSLTTAPDLPATEFARGCYSYMFMDCTSLESVSIAAKMDPWETSALVKWLYNTAASGVVYCPDELDLPSGPNGLPDGWIRMNKAVSTPVAALGVYCTFDLVDDLGVVINADYAAGDKVTVKLETLPKGLKLVATPVYEDPNAKKKVIKDYIYTVSGVPTEMFSFKDAPMFARVTVTKTVGKTTVKEETLQRVAFEVEPAATVALADGVLNQAYETRGIAALWPAVADAAVNPAAWSFKGWPAGVKYTAKDVLAKDKSVQTPAFSVYGTPTKAGAFPITATHKYKLADGKTTVSETFSAVMTVWGDDGATGFRYTDQAYVATATKTLSGVTAVNGLPAGVKWTAKAIAANGKTGTPAYPANSLYGTPTKPGVYAVTPTKSDKSKETFLWQVTEGENPGLGAAQVGWREALVKYNGVVTRTATLMQGLAADFAVNASALAAGAKVTVSGLPSGLKYDAKTGKITGVATKVEKKVVTVKVEQNGVTVTKAFAIDVAANPFAGAYYGAFSKHVATAVITPAVGGTAKLVLDEYVPSTHKVVKYTATAKGFSMAEEYDPENPLRARIVYEFALKADVKNNPDFAATERVFEVELVGGALGQGGLLFGYGSVSLRAKDDPSSKSDFSGQVYKALTAAAYATFVETTGMKPPPVMSGIVRDNAGRHLFTGTAVLDEKKLQYQVTGKLRDGTAVKVLQPLCWLEFYLGAPSLFVEKVGDKRANVALFEGSGKLNADIGIYEYDSVVGVLSAEGASQGEFIPFDASRIPGTAAEMIGQQDQLLVLDKDELAAAGFEDEAPVFRFRVEGVADLAKAKILVCALGAEPDAKPLVTLAPAKLAASSGYIFKGAFKWDAKVGGDDNTYSFELVPSPGSTESLVGRCEVKPAKGASTVVTATLAHALE